MLDLSFHNGNCDSFIFWDITLCTPRVLLSACLAVAPCLAYSFQPEHGGGVFSEMSVGFNWKTEPFSVQLSAASTGSPVAHMGQATRLDISRLVRHQTSVGGSDVSCGAINTQLLATLPPGFSSLVARQSALCSVMALSAFIGTSTASLGHPLCFATKDVVPIESYLRS